MSYSKKGSLRKCLSDIVKFKWQEKLQLLKKIILALKVIHESNLTHGDFHDGLCKPINDLQDSDNNTTNEPYGVLPYMAPEILRKNPYTPASDIYSFSMIMWEFSSGIQPFKYIMNEVVYPHLAKIARNTLQLQVESDIFSPTESDPVGVLSNLFLL
ncbi:kinase-like domain-containing protein [Rhizophagus diaphanus]|nr:kinase-like domain-containing protein [Rhizophagus diaphanus] [Rhizophagus sp. MUCL 43196]